MKEPKRLLSHGASDFERQLLRAVANERPSALLRSRMQRGLGLVGPFAWASNVKAMFGTLGSRVIAGLAVAGVVVAGSIVAVSSSGDTSAPAAPTAPAKSGEASRAAEGKPVPESASEALSPIPSPPELPVGAFEPAPANDGAKGEQGAKPGAPSEPPSLTADDNQLREEIALLDAARAALQRADRDAARTTLSTYRERFPNGVLRREAKVLWSRAEAKPE
jgi:hypothetical protein